MERKLLIAAGAVPLALTLSMQNASARQYGANPRGGAAGGDRPNIIFFLVDDMGWQDTSVQFWTERTKYNDIYETPNMERLAAQGMLFTQAYASSVSSPSRCSMLTGANAARHRVTNWTLQKDTPPDMQSDVLSLPDWNYNGIAQVPGTNNTFLAKSFVQYLRDGGYHTIHCGKAHWGAIDTPGENPCHFGFETNISGHAAGGLASYLGETRYGHDKDGNPVSLMAVPGLEKYWDTDTFVTEALTREALMALDKAREYNQPFYLYMSHYAIHIPIDRDARYFEKYRAKGLSDKEAAYAGLIEGMDKSLGDLMDWLEENGEADNTIIIFMGDNGGYATGSGWRDEPLYTQNSPLKCGKGSAYEGGIREPLIVYWPGGPVPDNTRDGRHKAGRGSAENRRQKFRAAAQGQGRPFQRPLPLLELSEPMGRDRSRHRGFVHGAQGRLEAHIFLRDRAEGTLQYCGGHRRGQEPCRRAS